MIQTAMGLHRQGRLAEAERSYRSILLQNPNHFEALHCLGLLKLQQGNVPEAVTLLRRAVSQRPQALDALFNLAGALVSMERYEEALSIYDRILSVAPHDPETLFGRGVALMQLRRHPEALASFERVLWERPDHIKALFNRANMLAAQDRYAEALASYDRVLALNPGVLQAVQNRGNVLVRLGRCEEALAAFARVLAQEPGNLDAQNGRAIALRELGRFEDALACCDQIIAADPNCIAALISRGNVLLRLDQPEGALANFDKALAVQPDDAEALNNRGLALHALFRHEEALASYDRVLARAPNHPGALNNRSATLIALNRPDEALDGYRRAVAIKGNDAGILNGYAGLLCALRRYDEALACYEGAVQLDPHSAKAHVGKASTLAFLGRYDEARVMLERAVVLRADDPDALHRLGFVNQRLGRLSEACACYERVLAIDPDHPRVLADLAFSYLSMCDWNNFARAAHELDARLADRKGSFPPFPLLAMPVEPPALLECTRRYVQATIPKPAQSQSQRGVRREGALRVAYLCAKFHRHATAYLTAGLFEQHDRSRVEPIGISFGPDDNSEMRERLIRAFDPFRDVSRISDQAVATMLQDLEVDVAVDLMGHTEDARPGILAYRPAPIQVAFLGYPGSMGVDFIDYVVADEIVLPADQQPFYSEQIVRLPDSYQVNDSKRPIADRVPTRSEMGLPEAAFVFCCFNQIWKINKPIFDVWMRLLHAVEGSVLWLLHSNELANANLRSEARAGGVDPQRLVFASDLEQSAHLARCKLADLALDTLPYNAHTTASDALWAGVPVVTCTGSTFAGRVAASLLYAVGLPELVTNNLDDYEALALKLATNPALLRSMQRKLEPNRLTYPLFDTARFARHLEAAYETMWETWRRGEPPRSFSVQPIKGSARNDG